MSDKNETCGGCGCGDHDCDSHDHGCGCGDGLSAYQHDKLERAVDKLINAQGFETQEEAEAWFDKLMQEKGADEIIALSGLDDDPRERAVELVFTADETEDEAEAVRLCREALEIDPVNVDAAMMILFIESDQSGARDAAKLVDGVSAILARFEAAHSQELQDAKGEMWYYPEFQPYLRAKDELVGLLFEADRPEDAMAVAEQMLELDEDDNLNLRDGLLAHFLAGGKLEKAADLLESFEGEDNAMWNLARVIERLMADDAKAAAELMATAHAANPHIVTYLTGKKDIPETEVEDLTPGSDGEAVHALQMLSPVLGDNEPVLEWMMQAAEKLAPKKPTRQIDRKDLKAQRKRGRR